LLRHVASNAYAYPGQEQELKREESGQFENMLPDRKLHMCTSINVAGTQTCHKLPIAMDFMAGKCVYYEQMLHTSVASMVLAGGTPNNALLIDTKPVDQFNMLQILKAAPNKFKYHPI